MTQENISSIRQQLADYLEASHHSQRKAAKQLGVSTTTLSFFLSGTYTGNNTEVATKAQQLLQMGAARKKIVQLPNICLTLGNTAAILRTVKIAHMHRNIALIFGPAGCSKSTTLKYCKETTNGIIYVEADATTSTPRSVLQLILDAMGESTKGTTATMMQRILKLLVDTDRLIIIDEAQHLTEKSFDTVRAINDKAHIGIVYAGNPSILQRMYGRQQEEFDQVYSRVVYKCKLTNDYTLEDIAAIYADKGFDKDCLKHLLGIARRKGGLRIMTYQCQIAQNIAISLDEAFTVQHLENAAALMGIGGQIS